MKGSYVRVSQESRSIHGDPHSVYQNVTLTLASAETLHVIRR